MKTLKLIGMISGALLLAFGFVHFLILDKLFIDKPNYLEMKYWAGQITIGLTIVAFGCVVIILILFLLRKREP